MTRTSNKPRPLHRRENGFEVCNHTCQQSPCINPRSKNILWPKEGSSCTRHARNILRHPGCKPPCPATSKRFTRVADPKKYPQIIREMLDAYCSPTDIDDFFSKHVAGWSPGRENWPQIPPSRYRPMDVDADQPSVGPSRLQGMEVVSEKEEGEEGEGEEEEEEEEEEEKNEVQHLTDSHYVTSSRPTSVTHGGRATSSRPPSIAMSIGLSTPDFVNPFPYPPRSVQPRTFKLLYIPDPSHGHRDREGVQYDLAWIKRNLTKDQLEAIRDMKGFYYEVRPTNATEGSACLLTEWLWAMICLSEGKTEEGYKAFDVSYMLWNDFKETLVNPRNPNNRTRWKFIRSHDIIIGGMDYTTESSGDFSDRNSYELHGDARKAYDATLCVLMRVVKFWPPIPQVRAAAQKWLITPKLDKIAAANGWQRPKTTVLMPGDAIPPGTVLKRSHSHCGEFVTILPPESVLDDSGAADRQRRQLQGLRSWLELTLRTSSNDQIWASQEYVETLSTLGEWRCFILAGYIAFIVHTIRKPDGHWHCTRVWQFNSLRQIRQLWANRNTTPVTADILAIPRSGDRFHRIEGWEEFRNFVDKTYRGLVTQESNTTGWKSSLTVFFRMDIGLIFDVEGKPSYFVNGIERTPTMNMWLAVAEDRIMLDTFPRILHTHITELDDIYNF